MLAEQCKSVQGVAQLGAAVLRDLVHHPLPDAARPADNEIWIESGDVVERNRPRQFVAVYFDASKSLRAARIIGQDADCETNLCIAGTPKQLALGFHQVAESEKPL